MKIFTGIVKKVPTEEQYQEFNEGKLDLRKLPMCDTLKTIETEEGSFQQLCVRLSYQSRDENGNDMYMLDPDDGLYKLVYARTAKMYATGKEMRILLELGEFCPVKVVVRENVKDDRTYYQIVCVQNQHTGVE